MTSDQNFKIRSISFIKKMSYIAEKSYFASQLFWKPDVLIKFNLQHFFLAKIYKKHPVWFKIIKKNIRCQLMWSSSNEFSTKIVMN